MENASDASRFSRGDCFLGNSVREGCLKVFLAQELTKAIISVKIMKLHRCPDFVTVRDYPVKNQMFLIEWITKIGYIHQRA